MREFAWDNQNSIALTLYTLPNGSALKSGPWSRWTVSRYDELGKWRVASELTNVPESGGSEYDVLIDEDAKLLLRTYAVHWKEDTYYDSVCKRRVTITMYQLGIQEPRHASRPMHELHTILQALGRCKDAMPGEDGAVKLMHLTEFLRDHTTREQKKRSEQAVRKTVCILYLTGLNIKLCKDIVCEIAEYTATTDHNDPSVFQIAEEYATKLEAGLEYSNELDNTLLNNQNEPLLGSGTRITNPRCNFFSTIRRSICGRNESRGEDEDNSCCVIQ